MKGQIIEMLFYPHFLIVLMLFFSNTILSEIDEVSVTKQVLKLSDSAISESNMLLLNCSRDHIIDFCQRPKEFTRYGIRRLVIDKGIVKELIFPSKN